MKKMIFAILSLTLLGMLPACCGCNWGCGSKKRYENGNGTKKTRRTMKNQDNTY